MTQASKSAYALEVIRTSPQGRSIEAALELIEACRAYGDDEEDVDVPELAARCVASVTSAVLVKLAEIHENGVGVHVEVLIEMVYTLGRSLAVFPTQEQAAGLRALQDQLRRGLEDAAAFLRSDAALH